MSDPFALFDSLSEPVKTTKVWYPKARVGGKAAARDEGDWDANPRKYTLKGQTEPTEFFTIGDLAQALGRKPVTIRSWESKGILPLPRVRGPKPQGEQIPGKEIKGVRLYTRGQVELVVQIAREEGILVRDGDPSVRVNYAKFTERVLAKWRSA